MGSWVSQGSSCPCKDSSCSWLWAWLFIFSSASISSDVGMEFFLGRPLGFVGASCPPLRTYVEERERGGGVIESRKSLHPAPSWSWSTLTQHCVVSLPRAKPKGLATCILRPSPEVSFFRVQWTLSWHRILWHLIP